MNTRFFVSAAVAVSTLAGAAFGQLSYTVPGSVYGNTFDNLLTAATLNPWANDVNPYQGWFLYNSTGAAIVDYNAHAGTNNTGRFYSFGSAGSSERALGGTASGGAYFGSPAAGSIAGWIAFAVTNNTGLTMTDFAVSFNGEQWRDGGAATPVAQTMVLEYGFGATFASVGTWTAPGGNFDWASPVITNTGSGAAVDGNAAGLVTGRGGTISNLTWNNGDTLWVRWVERNDFGNDHGLAIDNFGFSATPTPGAAALLGLGGLAMARRRR